MSNDDQMRELRFRNRQLRKTCGKQGETIFRLRAELAEARSLTSKVDRGELRRLERIVQEQNDALAAYERKLADEAVTA